MAPRNLSYDQFADAGPSPTKEDAYATVVHLADSAGFNLKHGAMHLKRTQDEVRKLPPSKQRDVAIWHANHSLKHHITAQDDLMSLVDHVQSHPSFKSAVAETGDLTRQLQGW